MGQQLTGLFTSLTCQGQENEAGLIFLVMAASQGYLKILKQLGNNSDCHQRVKKGSTFES